MSAVTAAAAALDEDSAGGRDALRANESSVSSMSTVVEVWGWTCPRCVIDSTPVASSGEAGCLAGVHDGRAHGGALTAWVWAGPLDNQDDQLDDQDDDQGDDVTSDGDGGRR